MSFKPGPAQNNPAATLEDIIGQALNPARPKIWTGQEDARSRRRLIKGDRRRLLRNYVSMRHRPEHAPSNPATTYGNRAFKGQFTTAEVGGGRGATGAEVERRRREDRGRVWGGLSLSPPGRGWGGGRAPAQKNF